MKVQGFELQESPKIFVASVPGKWLLQHSTPSWRIDDPELGFQRVVREERARQIAATVLDQGRAFPNAIVLATDIKSLHTDEHGVLTLPNSLKFLVVDGQHRLWAQHFSDKEANYACLVHLGLTEVQMAKLFLEINDNQKRVPSSLRWDLVRLVRPDNDPNQIAAADLVYELAMNRESPLYQRIDLTGEQGEIRLKQASVAPEIKSLVVSKREGLKGLDLENLYELLVRYLAAMRGYDADGWRSGESPFLRARVFRALLKLLPDVLGRIPAGADGSTASMTKILRRIDSKSLDTEAIKAHQGSAGIKQIYEMLRDQIAVED
jgi:DNA sulfur modification protein DndB